MNRLTHDKHIHDELVRVTCDLIRFKTVAGNIAEFQGCTEYIKEYFNRFGIRFREYEFNGVISFFAETGTDNTPDLMLMSHYDVVAGGDKLFEPEIRDNCIYGRGSLDDKYAAALSLVLLKNRILEASEGNQNLPSLGILITGDEESGGFDGAGKVLETLRPEFTIALDGGEVDEVIVEEKGLMHLKLTAHGTSCHASTPWAGENAIDRLINDFGILKQLFEVTASDHWHRTISAGRICGGTSVNQVPETCEMVVDIRFTSDDDMDELLDTAKKTVSSRLKIVTQAPVFKAGKSLWLEKIERSFPNIELSREHGASDARFLTDFGLNGVVWGANGDQSLHSDNEHVDINSLITLYRCLDRLSRES